MHSEYTALIITVSSVLFVIFFLLAFTYITYVITFRRRRRPIHLERDLGIKLDCYDEILRMGDELRKVPFEEITIKSHDGLKLVGRYYHRHDGAPIDILLHGYRSSPIHDFAGGVSTSFESGHNLLLVYHRSHGRSEGHAITFGEKEKHDLVLWCEYVTERFGEDTEILLTGISMGAATVILASALDLPKTVKCAIADCPYSSAKDEICLTVRKMHLPPSLVWPFIRLGAIIFARFDPEKTSVTEAARHSRIPIQLIHGEADSFVPKYMSDEIFAAHTGIMLYDTFPGADHGLSYIKDPGKYKMLCRELGEKYLKYKFEESK